MIYLAAYGYSYGNVSGVFRGIDKYGNVCGKGTLANYPYLYFSNPYATVMTDVRWRCSNYVKMLGYSRTGHLLVQRAVRDARAQDDNGCNLSYK